MSIINKNDLVEFKKNGFWVMPDLLPAVHIQEILDCVDDFAAHPKPGHVLEKNSDIYRAFHGCHLYSETFDALIRNPKFLSPAQEILQDDVYLHQLKVNLKHAFSGELWPWHQDYIYWRNEDSIASSAIVSVMIFLDDITEFNGPLYFIPGSHHQGCIEPKASEDTQGGWENNVSKSLTYQVSETLVSSLVEKNGLFSAKGKKGTVVWFDANLVHASPENISPWQRRIVILTYNAVSNAPTRSSASRRPDFLNSQDYRPLKELHPV